MSQFKKPPYWQVNPQTPPPSTASGRDTDRLRKEDYLRRLRDSLEDTSEQISISAPKSTKFEKDGLEDAPHILVIWGAFHHIESRTDRTPPAEAYVSKKNYQKIEEYFSCHSPEGFTGKIPFGAFDGTDSIQIGLGHEGMPAVNETIPDNTVICIHGNPLAASNR